MEEGLLQVQKPNVNVNDVLESFIESAHKTKGNLDELVCEQCGISYIEFRNHGLLGCAHDYDTFKDALGELIERAQDGNDHHVGKAPRSTTKPKRPQQDLRRLKRQLNEAVAAEDYERAAELRDKIEKLEQA
jgi:protein arginine kinase activator